MTPAAPYTESIHKLICLPYAGGTSSYFRHLSDCLSPSIKVLPLDISGHGQKSNQKYFRTIYEMASDIAESSAKLVKGQDFSILGYSMGAFIAFELAKLLIKDFDLSPSLLFIVAQRSPEITTSPPYWFKLKDDELLEKLLNLNGLSGSEYNLMKPIITYMLPVIRADLEAVELYKIEGINNAIDVPIHAIFGKEDQVAGQSKMLTWKNFTRSEFDISGMDGTHFFLNECKKEIARKIISNIERV
ncbi:MAG: thioesterase [Rhizobiales bacterium]|nr:thioesterase [Hyphomicrobiales bacterium]